MITCALPDHSKFGIPPIIYYTFISVALAVRLSVPRNYTFCMDYTVYAYGILLLLITCLALECVRGLKMQAPYHTIVIIANGMPIYDIPYSI